MAGIDRKGKDSAGIAGNGAGIVPWSLRNNGGSGEGITPSNGAKAGVTPNVKTYSGDAGETFDVDSKQQLATTPVYATKYTDSTTTPAFKPDPNASAATGASNYADNSIIGGPKNNQSQGAPAGSVLVQSEITSYSPVKGNNNQFSNLGE